METYCTTCGSYDTRISNGDNACCKECGDTEGLVYLDDYLQFISSTTLGGDCPNQYLRIYTENEVQARIASRAVLDKNWSFIYSEENGELLITSWGWKEHEDSPVILTKEQLETYKQKVMRGSNDGS